jgi:CRISPR system Cascade subunit CasB
MDNTNFSTNFISSIINHKNDVNYISKWKRADNPNQEYQAWELLVPWCKELTNPYEREPLATIGAAFARRKTDTDGQLNFGRALYHCYPENNSGPGTSRLRRMLACSDTLEVCKMIKPCLSLIASKDINLNYSSLLNDIKYFSERTKLFWAQEFYRGGNNGDSKSNID